jgi:hypothetical protein
MEELRPEWYEALQQAPLRNKTFTDRLSARILAEVARPASRNNRKIRSAAWIGAGVIAGSVIVLAVGTGMGKSIWSTNGRDHPAGAASTAEGYEMNGTPPAAISTPLPTPSPSSISSSSQPTEGATASPNPFDQKGGYVVHDGAYYTVTGKEIEAGQIGVEIGRVTRIGDWSLGKEGDSNYYGPGAVFFTIKGIPASEKMAVRIKANQKAGSTGKGYLYLEYVRYAAVEKPDLSKILGAKNDPEEVAIAMENVRKADPFLYEFKGLGKGTELNFVSYRNDTNDIVSGTYLMYRIPEADLKKGQIQGEFTVAEYSEEMKNAGNIQYSIFAPQPVGYVKDSTDSSAQPRPTPEFPTVTDEFDLGSMHWTVYKNNVYIGQKADRYYEIQIQGELPEERMKELLVHFVPSV